MSTPVDNSLTNLKASTGQIMAIISATRQIPLGPSHSALGKQVATLVADVVKEYGSGDGPLPGLIISCSKELLRVWNMVPKVWPDWHSIGYDDPCILRHTWYPKALAWKALGDPTFDLPTAAPPPTGPIPVNLPSPAILAGNVTGPSTNPIPMSWDKGKGKAVFPTWRLRQKGSAMKSHKCQRSGCLVKSKCIVELEGDEDSVVQPLSRGVPEVVLPWLSTIVARTPNSPRSPRAPMKKPFGPARVIAGSHPAVMEPSQPTPEPPAQAPPVMPVVDILIPSLNNPCYACHKLSWPCATRLDKRTKAPCMSCIYCTTKKIKCTPANMGSPPPHVCAPSTTRKTRSMTPSGAPSKTPSKAPPASQTPGHSKAPPASQSKARTCSQSCGPASTSRGTAVTTPQTQMHGCSKTITAIKPPAPAPAAAHKSPKSAVPAAAPGPAVPAAALGVPMPDLHAMSHAIRDAAARIALLEARVAEQDGKIDTLQHLHEGLRRKIIDRHPSFPLPDTPANAASLLLDQSGPRTMSPPESTLLPLIDLSMETLAPTTATPTFSDASAIEGLLFDYDQVVHPEDRDASSNIVDPGDPSNLVPEYDSSNNMDVEMEVKVDESLSYTNNPGTDPEHPVHRSDPDPSSVSVVRSTDPL
ncbi:hypothetical protein BDR03DRAFT_1016598 [Suillus americanus]|nr:hypothetical protein BDR03DRAFT_1016598 [Suillus americanus]